MTILFFEVNKMKFTVTSHLSFLPNYPISTQFDLGNIQDIKIALMKIINVIIDNNSWVQGEAAEILKVDQPKVSSIKHLKTIGFSLERILLFLLRLNCHIDLSVTLPDNISIIDVQPDIKNTKLEVMYLIVSIIAKCNLSQKKAASLMEIDQPKVSHINRLKTVPVPFTLISECKSLVLYPVAFI